MHCSYCTTGVDRSEWERLSQSSMNSISRCWALSGLALLYETGYEHETRT